MSYKKQLMTFDSSSYAGLLATILKAFSSIRYTQNGANGSAHGSFRDKSFSDLRLLSLVVHSKAESMQ